MFNSWGNFGLIGLHLLKTCNLYEYMFNNELKTTQDHTPS